MRAQKRSIESKEKKKRAIWTASSESLCIKGPLRDGSKTLWLTKRRGKNRKKKKKGIRERPQRRAYLGYREKSPKKLIQGHEKLKARKEKKSRPDLREP